MSNSSCPTLRRPCAGGSNGGRSTDGLVHQRDTQGTTTRSCEPCACCKTELMAMVLHSHDKPLAINFSSIFVCCDRDATKRHLRSTRAFERRTRKLRKSLVWSNFGITFNLRFESATPSYNRDFRESQPLFTDLASAPPLLSVHPPRTPIRRVVHARKLECLCCACSFGILISLPPPLTRLCPIAAVSVVTPTRELHRFKLQRQLFRSALL